MRVSRSSSVAAAATTLMVWLAPLVASISVPTGKLTPITPARPTAPPVNPHARSAPAAVVEYTPEHPEPPPLDPSYVPPTFNYFDTLARHHVYYVPVRYRNFNAVPNNFSPVSNSIDYEPPQKYFGQTLGKNVGYSQYKQRSLPAVDWRTQYNQYNTQYNSQYNSQYSAQPTPLLHRQQQQYEVVSTQAAPASTGLPQPQSQQPTLTADYPTSKSNYDVTGKGSYDVTGKGGSKSDTEYYSKDWSKKSSYPKKVPATPRKFVGHKF